MSGPRRTRSPLREYDWFPGPPLIGHLAEAVTLPVALAVLPLLTAGVAVAVKATKVFARATAPALAEPGIRVPEG